jgi:hypothetical protein
LIERLNEDHVDDHRVRDYDCLQEGSIVIEMQRFDLLIATATSRLNLVRAALHSISDKHSSEVFQIEMS